MISEFKMLFMRVSKEMAMARRTGGRMMIITAKRAAEICREWYVAFRNKGKGEEKCVLELLDVADTIEALEAAQPKWISVKEKLPENDDNYLVFTSDKNVAEIATYYGDGEWLTHDLTNLTPLVTHWMPLPVPPRSDDHD